MDPKAPPVAVRVLRPFANEDALLEAEANAFTRTGVVLIGAPSRPNGVVLRFEICLRDGQVAMRGEGRVVGFRAQSAEEESALMLRFTRLDVKSKALLDRAVAIREERRSLAPPSQPRPPAKALTPPPPPPRAPTPPPPPLPPPPSSVAPNTERDHVADNNDDDDDDDDAMDVDDADLTSADEEDLTQQAPPVAMMADILAHQAAEKLPVPQPPPVEPAPHPVAPKTPPPKPMPKEHAPPQQAPREKMPIPQPSPGPKRHASELVARARGERNSGEFRPSLEPGQRDSALDRLRERKRTSQA